MALNVRQLDQNAKNVINDPWYQQNGKENHRPPVFFAEDYISGIVAFFLC